MPCNQFAFHFLLMFFSGTYMKTIVLGCLNRRGHWWDLALRRHTDLARCGLDFWYQGLAVHLGAEAIEDWPLAAACGRGVHTFHKGREKAKVYGCLCLAWLGSSIVNQKTWCSHGFYTFRFVFRVSGLGGVSVALPQEDPYDEETSSGQAMKT